MQHRFRAADVAWCVVAGELIVDTDPDASPLDVMRQFRDALRSEDLETKVKAYAALAMTDTREEAAAWFVECDEAHVFGDCPLCGAT